MNTALQQSQWVRVIEIWKPNQQQNNLALAEGHYGDLAEFESASVDQVPATADTFVARVFRERTPLVFTDLYETRFERFEAAQQAGLTSGLAWPLIDDDQVTAVVLLLFDASHGASGACELWKREERAELGLQGEYYANLDRVSNVSQFVKFPLGAGLPGRVWEDRFPRLLTGIGRGSGFARGTELATADIQWVIAFPIMRRAFDLECVVLMFSTATTPLASAMELWQPHTAQEETTLLKLDHACYAETAVAAETRRELSLASGEGLEGRVLQTRLPQLSNGFQEFNPAYRQPLLDAGFSMGLAFPVFVGPNLVSVISMFR